MASRTRPPPTTLGGRYQLVEVIGTGGMATVWRAFDTRLRRPVAVKLVSEHLAADPGFRRRFQREAHHVASLSHPNVVAVYDFGVDGERAFLVMEYVPGPSLRDVLRASGTLSIAGTAALACDTLDALDRAHGQGLVHRDVKPGNILIAPGGVTKVADFGVATSAFDSTNLTLGGTVVGTAAYASPEQLAGSAVGPTSDLYSLACVLYESLGGRPPFEGDDVAKVVLQQRFAEPQPLAERRDGVPPAMEAAIMRALAKDPVGRFPTARAMRQALGPDEDDLYLGRSSLAASAAAVTVGAGRSAPTGPTDPWGTEPDGGSPARRAPSRRRLLVAGAAALAAAALALLAFAVLAHSGSAGPGGATRMLPGELLRSGQPLTTPNGAYRLSMRQDGDLVTTDTATGQVTWQSDTGGNPGAYAVMQTDGDFVVYPPGRSAPLPGQPSFALWYSGTFGNPGATVALEDDGNLAVTAYQSSVVLWQSRDVPGPEGSELLAGSQLHAGQYLRSPDGRYRLVDTSRGVLTLYRTGRGACVLWSSPSSGGPGSYVVMQQDGNLVLYRAAGAERWQTHTDGDPGASLALENGGALVLSSAAGSTLWQATTAPTGPTTCRSPSAP